MDEQSASAILEAMRGDWYVPSVGPLAGEHVLIDDDLFDALKSGRIFTDDTVVQDVSFTR